MAHQETPSSSEGKRGAKTASGGEGTGTGSLPYTHADFTYVRRKRKLLEEEDVGELNIVPYLDILVNLIMFLLVTQATLVSLGLVDVSAPTYAAVAPSPNPGDPDDKGKNLRLTIGVAAEGFFIAGKGAVLSGQEPPPDQLTGDGIPKREPTVPKRPDGTYDFPALTAKLRLIKTEFPMAEQVFVAADDNIPYEILVKTLDASREDARGPLFPAVAFTQIN